MKKSIKLTVPILTFGLLISPIGEIIKNNEAHAHYVSSTEVRYDHDGKIDRKTQLAGEKVAKYFVKTKNNGIKLNVTKEKLAKEVGISVRDAELMIQATNDLSKSYESGQVFIQSRGYFGVTVRLGSKVRSMSRWAAAAYATGYSAWHLRTFARTPHTAGVVGVLSTAIGGAVGWAVSKGTAYNIPVGVNIPGRANYNFYINIP